MGVPYGAPDHSLPYAATGGAALTVTPRQAPPGAGVTLYAPVCGPPGRSPYVPQGAHAADASRACRGRPGTPLKVFRREVLTTPAICVLIDPSQGKRRKRKPKR